VIIIDPEGEFATLREKYGYVLVGKGGETPADPRSAALVAHKLLELKASAVCDLYEMKPATRHEWVRRFLEAMIDAPKNLWHPCVVIVDEAHVFCPEKGAGESEASEGMIGLATRGRKRGFACIFATQRLGKLRKDAAAELLNIMVGGTFIDVDRKRAADALGVYGADVHKFFDEIKVLERGYFYALGPAISLDRILVHVGNVETTHPEAGSAKHGAEPPPAPARSQNYCPKLSDLPKAAEEKARTEAELRTEIRSLKAQLRSQILRLIAEASAQAVGIEPPKFGPIALPKVSGGEILRKEHPPMRTPSSPENIPAGDVNLKSGARKMLTILAQWHPEPKTRDELGALAGFAPTGGTFSDYLSKLRIAGYIHENGNGIAVTDEGMQAAGDIPERPNSTEELVGMWRSKLKSGVGRMLDVLVAEYPEALTREDLGEKSGFAASGGTFSDYLSQLRRARLIEESSGQVKAAESLFP
jgi:hypothetical protein